MRWIGFLLLLPTLAWAQAPLCTLRESATPVALYRLACLEIEVQQQGESVTIVERSRQEVLLDEATYSALMTAPDAERAPHCPAGPWNLYALLGGIPNPAVTDTPAECSFTDSTTDPYVYIRVTDPVEGVKLHAVDKRQHTPQKQGRQIRTFVPPLERLDISNGEVRRR